MKQRLKIVMVAMLGLGMTGILLASISAHAEPLNKHGMVLSQWDGGHGKHGGRGH